MSIKCYAPELSGGNADFPKESFEALYRLEAGSFWFRGRQRIIEHLVRKYLSGPAAFLEIGCGTGFVLNGLRQFKNLRLTGAEVNLAGLVWAEKRLEDVELVQLDATRLPYESTFDAVGAFDVIEHIDNDALVLKSIHGSLKENGLLFLTVPQHRSLWSRADDMAMHKRRYSRGELLNKLSGAGFEALFVSSFIFLLFPAMYLSRLMKRTEKTREALGACELNLPPWLDAIGEMMMRFEEKFLFAGISLPWGGSLVCVARKRTHA